MRVQGAHISRMPSVQHIISSKVQSLSHEPPLRCAGHSNIPLEFGLPNLLSNVVKGRVGESQTQWQQQQQWQRRQVCLGAVV